MSGYVPGEMDITEQKRTYAMVIKGGIWFVAITAAVLIFLAIIGT